MSDSFCHHRGDYNTAVDALVQSAIVGKVAVVSVVDLLDDIARLGSDNPKAKVRDHVKHLAKAHHMAVKYDVAAGTITVDLSRGYTAHGDADHDDSGRTNPAAYTVVRPAKPTKVTTVAKATKPADKAPDGKAQTPDGTTWHGTGAPGTGPTVKPQTVPTGSK